MSEVYQSLSHSKWDCKYHVVFVPKRRRKAIFGQTRRQLGTIFHALARQKECQIIEGHLMRDHVHMCIAIPPKPMRRAARDASFRGPTAFEAAQLIKPPAPRGGGPDFQGSGRAPFHAVAALAPSRTSPELTIGMPSPQTASAPLWMTSCISEAV